MVHNLMDASPGDNLKEIWIEARKLYAHFGTPKAYSVPPAPTAEPEPQVFQ